MHPSMPPPVSAPGTTHLAEHRRQRYDQCDETCTTDCGHCKGAGRPTYTRPDDGLRDLLRALHRDHCAGTLHVPVCRTERVLCRNAGPKYRCTRPVGHTGRHSFVWLQWGHVRAVWP